jgi:alanyl-tRNA synthetase
VRALIAKNHTATHLLHAALRRKLGPHVKQAGSLVNADLLRFDFSHGKAVSPEELEAIENEINEKLLDALPVVAEEMGKEAALGKGAIAFFGDKYGDKVRVLSVGSEKEKYSVELCGGTHVRNTSDIMGFKILNENGIAAGVRRIVAVTGPKVVELARKRDLEVKAIMARVGASAPDEILTRIDKLEASEKEARKALDAHARKAASNVADDWIKAATTHGGGMKFVRGIFPTDKDTADVSGQVRDLTENLRYKLANAVIAVGAFDHGKQQAMIVVGVTKDLIAKVKAGEIIKQVAPLIEGKGGGKPELAQAGGKHPEKFPEVFKAIEGLIN